MIQEELNKKLIYAAKNSKLDRVKAALKEGADIHAEDDYALYCASENGHLSVVEYLVENGADIHARGYESLRHAAVSGHLDVVRYLVENGADIHACDDQALLWAAHADHLSVVKYLVENGADIHARGYESLRHAAEAGHLDIVKYLVGQGAQRSLHERSECYADTDALSGQAVSMECKKVVDKHNNNTYNDIIRIALHKDGKALYFEYDIEGDLHRLQTSEAFNRIQDGAPTEVVMPDLDENHQIFKSKEKVYLTKN